MGKIMVIGKAEREYAADCCNITLEVETARKTAGEASKVSSEICENLLKKLRKLGIEPDRVNIDTDRITRKADYRSDKISYESRKRLRTYIPADMQLVNTIRSIIESGFDEVEFGVSYSVSNEAELNRQLLKDTIADSRNKAELLASSMGHRIAGIDSANLSGDEDVFDLTEEDKEEDIYYMCQEDNRYPLSDKLKPGEVSLSAEVKVVWLIE